jgi:hypothetical protein
MAIPTCDRCDSTLNVNNYSVCAQCLEEIRSCPEKNLLDAKSELIRYIRNRINIGLLLIHGEDDSIQNCYTSPWMWLNVRYTSEKIWLLSIVNPKTRDMKYKDSDVDPVQLFKRTIQWLEL